MYMSEKLTTVLAKYMYKKNKDEEYMRIKCCATISGTATTAEPMCCHSKNKEIKL